MSLGLVWCILYMCLDIVGTFMICSSVFGNIGETLHLKERYMVRLDVMLLCRFAYNGTQRHYDVTRFEYLL